MKSLVVGGKNIHYNPSHYRGSPLLQRLGAVSATANLAGYKDLHALAEYWAFPQKAKVMLVIFAFAQHFVSEARVHRRK